MEVGKGNVNVKSRNRERERGKGRESGTEKERVGRIRYDTRCYFNA